MAKNFITYLEEHPKLYAIAKSEMCIGLLKILEKQGLPIVEIKKKDYYSKFKEEDLETLLELLVSLKLLDKEKINNKIIYFGNEHTKEFLKIYDETRKQFSL